MNNYRRYYFQGGNVILNIIILAIIVVAGFWVIDLFAVYLPALLTLLLKAFVVLYGVFGLIAILSNPDNV